MELKVTVANQSARELGAALPERIRLLSSLITRKPATYTPQWASTVDQAFTLYTRTQTINLLQSLNHGLIDLDWPFPGYLDLPAEIAKASKDLKWTLAGWFERLRLGWHGPSLFLSVLESLTAQRESSAIAQDTIDGTMVHSFQAYENKVFEALLTARVLKSKKPILKDLEQAYRRRMWAACITTTFPLLDFVVRTFFATQKINVTIQVLRDAFVNKANLQPKDLMPGLAVWDGLLNPTQGNTFAKTIEEDLRLPGIYLSSFFEFADRYYGWYKSTGAPARIPLNRHAIMHGAYEYWTQPNAVRMLTFLDLVIRLEPALRVLIHGENAMPLFKEPDSLHGAVNGST